MPAASDVTITHPDRRLFPDGTTKGDLVAYYRGVADTMLPHLRGRPLMLQRFPRGVERNGFYQKEAGDLPEWIDTVTVGKAGGTVTHAVCDDAATLIYLANADAITLHTWPALADRPDRPDRMIFDLDPPGDDFAPIRSAAFMLRERLDAIGLVPYVQTTGSRGLHVVVPLERRAGFDAVRDLARSVAAGMAADEPDAITVESRKAARGDRLYVDVMRNAYAQTSVAPYTVRARPEPTVATPLRWDELRRASTRPGRYTIGSVRRRLARTEDPWAEIAADARPLSAARLTRLS